MSLDVYLHAVTTCPHCQGPVPTDETVYRANITHNLGLMAREAGIYEACWRPEEIGISRAEQLIPYLRAGLDKMRADPAHYSKFNAENGWGLYDNFVPWVAKYLAACEENPQSAVKVWR